MLSRGPLFQPGLQVTKAYGSFTVTKREGRPGCLAKPLGSGVIC